MIRFITYFLGFQNVLDDLYGEENSSNWLNEEHDVQMADVEEEHGEQMDDVEEERDLGNDGGDDDLGDVFDWYQFMLNTDASVNMSWSSSA